MQAGIYDKIAFAITNVHLQISQKQIFDFSLKLKGRSGFQKTTLCIILPLKIKAEQDVLCFSEANACLPNEEGSISCFFPLLFSPLRCSGCRAQWAGGKKSAEWSSIFYYDREDTTACKQEGACAQTKPCQFHISSFKLPLFFLTIPETFLQCLCEECHTNSKRNLLNVLQIEPDICRAKII